LQAFFSQNAPVAPAASCLHQTPSPILQTPKLIPQTPSPSPLLIPSPFAKSIPFCKKKLPFTHFLLASLLILRYIKECFIKFM